MPQFLVDPADLLPGSSEAVLVGAEAHHLLRVHRARLGDAVDIFDGLGSRWRGRLQTVGGGQARIADLAPLPANESPAETFLVQGLLKGERWDWLISKATELGVSAVVPICAERSVSSARKPASDPKGARWTALSLAAAKQCERARPAAVAEPRGLKSFLETLGPPDPTELRLLFSERVEGTRLSRSRAVRRIYLAVGPEGGWSDAESKAFQGAGFQTVSLGSRILRAETAALAALTLTQAAWGDLVGDDGPW